MTLVLLANPETECETSDYWIGNEDDRLGCLSVDVNMDSLKRDLNEYKFGRIYTTPYEYSNEVLEILGLDNATYIRAFSPRNLGSLTSRSYRKTMNEFPRRKWLEWERSYWVAPPEGESFFDISNRVLDAFRSQVLPIQLSESVLILASPDVLRTLIGYLRKSEEADIPKINIERMVPYVISGELPRLGETK